MKKILKLWKVFTSSKKNILSIFWVGMLLGLIPNLVQLVFLSSENEIIRVEKEEYGSYGVCVGDYTDSDYKKMEHDSNVKSIKTTEEYTISIDENIYYLDYAKNFDLDLMGIKLVKGKLPTADSEMVIDEQYVSSHGYDHSIIGQKISIPISEEKERKFLVTGIASKNSVWDDTSKEFFFLAYKNNCSYNSAYASFIDYTDLDGDYTRLEQELDGTIYPNLNIYLDLGYGFGGISIFQQYDLIHTGVFAFMLLSMCFVVYNIAKMCMFDNRESIGIMRLIGIQRKNIIFSFVCNILCWILLGILSGLLISIAMVAVVHASLYHTLSYYWKIWSIYPVKKILLSIIICLVIIVLVLFPLIVCISRMSPNELLRQESIFEKHKRKKGKRLFHKNTKRVCLKLAINDIRYEKFMNIISVFGIALGTVIITSAVFYMKTNYAVISGNYQYQYRIDMISCKDYSDDNYEKMVEKLYKNNYNFSSSVQTHSLFTDYISIDIPADKLSNNYADYLSQDPDKYRRIMRNQNVSVNINILGYDDIELERLYKKNGMDNKVLAEDEAIVLDYLYSSSMESSNFCAPFSKQDEIVFSKQNSEQVFNNLKVKNTVSKLTIYPETGDLSIVMIVNTESFQKICESSLPEYVYIDKVSDKEDLENLELLKSNSQFRISSPAKEEEELVYFNRILNIFIYIIFFICIGVAALLLYSSYYLKIHINKKEYAMLHTIGLHTRKVQRIVLLEMLLSYLFGVVISFSVSYIFTEKIYLVKYPLIGTYLYDFPVDTFIFSCLITLIISSIVWCYILKKLKSVLNIHVLHAL